MTRAYRYPLRLEGEFYIILNNMGYSYPSRGDIRMARRPLERAHDLVPTDPTIIDNIAIMDSGQAYLHGFWTLRPRAGEPIRPLPHREISIPVFAVRSPLRARPRREPERGISAEFERELGLSIL